jgi:hypothetical protein
MYLKRLDYFLHYKFRVEISPNLRGILLKDITSLLRNWLLINREINIIRIINIDILSFSS